MMDKTPRMTAAELRAEQRRKPQPARQREHRESVLQVAVVQFLEVALPADATYFHVPNEGKRDEVTGGILKAMGLRAGVADLIIIWRGYALSIELKDESGSETPAQKDWAETCKLCHIPHTVARSILDVETFLSRFGVPLTAHCT